MRIKKLILENFGVFSGRIELDLSREKVNVIIGNNETGKSTIMKGLTALLFGISPGDRSKYHPWDAPGIGSGSIELERGGDMRIERDFSTNRTRLLIEEDGVLTEKYSGDANPRGQKESKRYFRKLTELIKLSGSDMLESLTFVNQRQMETGFGAGLREIITGTGAGDYLQAEDGLKSEAEELVMIKPWKRGRNKKLIELAEDKLASYKKKLEESLSAREKGGDIEKELSEARSEFADLSKELADNKSWLETVRKYIETVKTRNSAQWEAKTRRRAKEERELQEEKLNKQRTFLNSEQVRVLGDSADKARSELTEIDRLTKSVVELESNLEELGKKQPSGKSRLDIKKRLTGSLLIGLFAGAVSLTTESLFISALIFVATAILSFIVLTFIKPAGAAESARHAAKVELLNTEISRSRKALSDLRDGYAAILENMTIKEALSLADEIIKKKENESAIADILDKGESSKDIEKALEALYVQIGVLEGRLEAFENDYAVLKSTERDIEAAARLEHELSGKVKDISHQIDSLDSRVREMEQESAERRGKGIENIDILEEKIQEEEESLAAQRQELDALLLAVSTLEECVEEYQATYNERIAENAADWFIRFTGDKYSSVALDDDWEPVITTKEGKEIKPEDLSVGASDQLYFALRAAMASALAPEIRLPMVLDDPFVNFDDGRLEAARVMLSELSKEHQVILLTHDAEYAEWGKVALDLNKYWRKK